MKLTKYALAFVSLFIIVGTQTSCKKNTEPSPNNEPSLSQPLLLGKYIANSEMDPTCPAGYTCYGFEVEAPGVTKNERGFLAVAPYRGIPRGLVMFFTGGGGVNGGQGALLQSNIKWQKNYVHLVLPSFSLDGK